MVTAELRMVSYRPDSTSGFHRKIEHLVQDPNFAVASLDHYVLLVWRRDVTVAGARAVAAALTRLHALKPKQKLGFITVITDTTVHSASSEVRQLMAATLKTHNLSIGAAAIAYELDGFWSAITRSVITAINIASRPAFPSEVSADVQDAIRFVTRELLDSSETRSQTLRAALDSMRDFSAFANQSG